MQAMTEKAMIHVDMIEKVMIGTVLCYHPVIIDMATIDKVITGQDLIGLGYKVRSVRHEATTNASGEFTLEDVPVAGRLTIVARLGERLSEPVSLPIDSGTANDLSPIKLVLPALQDRRTVTLRGTVRLPDGRPAARTTVAAGGVVTQTKNDGSYELAVENTVEVLGAVRSGIGFTTLALDELIMGGNEVLCPDLLLRANPLAIEGIVLGPDETPLANARVWIGAATKLPGLKQSLEDLAVGRTSGYVETNDSGEFVLDGLNTGDYTLWVRSSGRDVPMDPIAAGTTGVVLRLR